jgi:hypothetical protein
MELPPRSDSGPGMAGAGLPQAGRQRRAGAAAGPADRGAPLPPPEPLILSHQFQANHTLNPPTPYPTGARGGRAHQAQPHPAGVLLSGRPIPPPCDSHRRWGSAPEASAAHRRHSGSPAPMPRRSRRSASTRSSRRPVIQSDKCHDLICQSV